MNHRRIWLRLTPALAGGIPALVVRLTGSHLSPLAASVCFGLAIIGASFLLAWSAEAAEHDVAGGVAVALVAFVAVLPEYAVDAYFAFKGGTSPTFRSYAAANMTGANRLLIGVGWPLVAMITIARRRSRGAIKLDTSSRVELGNLLIASVLITVALIADSILLALGLVLMALYFAYVRRLAGEDVVEPELIGTAALLGALSTKVRRRVLAAVFIVAAGYVLVAAAPFADGLLATGAQFGIDNYLLVQWVAPLASEAPEFIVATLFALRSSPAKALAVLLSSKVVQWLLLLGGLPVVYGIGGGGLFGLPLDPRQEAEIALTLAQTVLGVALLLRLRLGTAAATMLLLLFAAQFAVTTTQGRWGLALGYTLIAMPVFYGSRRDLAPTFRATIRPRK